MTQTIESLFLDGGNANGQPINVGSSNPMNPTRIHLGPADAMHQDAVFLIASNTGASEVELRLIWNENTDPSGPTGNELVFRIPHASTMTLVSGLRLGQSNNPMGTVQGISAYVALGAHEGLVNVNGWVDRISQNPTA